MSHTPTPWKTDGRYIRSDDCEHIADCHPMHRGGEKVAEANAAYIVKAVNEYEDLQLQCVAYRGHAERQNKLNAELAEALKRLMTQMNNIILICDVPQRFAESFNAGQKQAEAALAKAGVK